MQIGMDPGRILARFVIDAVMRLVPIALGVPPQSLQRRTQSLGRSVLFQRLLEGREIHAHLPFNIAPRIPRTICRPSEEPTARTADLAKASAMPSRWRPAGRGAARPHGVWGPCGCGPRATG